MRITRSLTVSARGLITALALLAASGSGQADLEFQPLGNWPGPLRSFNSGAVGVSGRYAFVTRAGPGLNVFEIGESGPPRSVGMLPTASPTEEIAVVGGLAHVSDSEGRMLVLDIGEPAQPRLVSVFDTDGQANSISAAGTQAYLAVSYPAKPPAIQIVDLSNPAQPRLLSVYSPAGYDSGAKIQTVAGDGEYVCVAGRHWDGTNDTATLEALDIQNPATPRSLGIHRVLGRVDDQSGYAATVVAVANGRAYFASYNSGSVPWRIKVEILDLRDPSGPKVLGSYGASGQVYGMAVAGDFLYVSRYWYPQGAVDIVRVSDPARPVRIGGTTTSSTEANGPPTDGHPRLALGQGILCLATWAELRSFDLSDPGILRAIGKLTLDRYTVDVAVAGNRACTADITGLSLLDISDPSKPMLLGSALARYPVERAAVSGNYGYVAGVPGLYTFDLSNPAAPRRTGLYTEWVSDFAIAGDLLFLAGRETGLHVLSLTNPATPRFLGSQSTSGINVDAVAAAGHYVYVSSRPDWSPDGPGPATIEVFDVSEPAFPQLVGTYPTRSVQAARIGVSESLGVVAGTDDTGQGLVEVLDVRDPSNLTLLASYTPYGSYGSKVTVGGNRAYISFDTYDPLASTGGPALEVIDLSDPTHPKPIGFLPGGRTYAVAGDVLYASDPGVQTVRMSEATLAKVGLIEIPGETCGLCVEGTLGYAAAGTNGLHVLDLTKPAQPKTLGQIETGGTAWDVAVAGQRAFVAAGEVGLLVMNVSNPAAPRLLGAYDTDGDARSVLLSGSFAYLADGGNGVQAVDVSDPASPRRVGGYATTGRATALALQGNHLLAACREAGLVVLDISNPADPKPIGTYNGGGLVLAVAVMGSNVLIADGMEGLMLLDLANPASPRVVGSTPGGGYARGITVSGRFAYVADSERGLQAFDLVDPSRPRQLAGNASLRPFRLAAAGGWIYAAAGREGIAYFAPPPTPVSLQASPAATAGALQLRIDGPAGTTARVQRSVNLELWEDLQTITLGAAPTSLTIPCEGARQFYRLQIP